MIAHRQLSAGAVLCPHPDTLARHAIEINGGKGPMVVCPNCKAMFEGLIRGWHHRELSPAVIVDTMRQNGYTRRDAAQFLLQLCADRLRVRLGFARLEDLI